MNLTNIYRIFRQATTEHTFFSGAHRNFSKIDHNLECKGSPCEHKKFKITFYNSSEHSGIKLEISWVLVAHTYSTSYSGRKNQL
jgi:hypothetical protein